MSIRKLDELRRLQRERKRPRGAERQVDMGSAAAETGNFVGRIVKCDKDSGKAKVRRVSGAWGSLALTSDTTEITVWVGKQPIHRVGHDVLCVPCGSGVTPEYYVADKIFGATNAIPDDLELATVQDSPGQITSGANDSVP